MCHALCWSTKAQMIQSNVVPPLLSWSILSEYDFIIQHYTIDIVAAYFVTVSIHKSYQTMVAATKLGIPHDQLPYRHSWWYPIYNFIES